MKLVTWLSTERIIPNHCFVQPGDAVYLPDDLADKFVKQGDASFKAERTAKNITAREGQNQELSNGR